MVAYHLVDEVAERLLDLIDTLNEEIDELEDHVEDWPAGRVRQRLSELRHDLLRIRKTVAPTRDAVHTVVDGRVDARGRRGVPSRRRAPFRGRLRQAPARRRRARALARSRRRRSRLLPGEDRERPERRREATHGDRVAPARADLHRRALRPELHQTCPSCAGRSATGGPGAGSSSRPFCSSGTSAARAGSRHALATIAAVPYFICPNCKERSIDHDRREGLSSRPSPATAAASVSCSSCSRTTTRRRTPASSSVTATRGSSPSAATCSSCRATASRI